jgi:hypothetical protein
MDEADSYRIPTFVLPHSYAGHLPQNGQPPFLGRTATTAATMADSGGAALAGVSVNHPVSACLCVSLRVSGRFSLSTLLLVFALISLLSLSGTLARSSVYKYFGYEEDGVMIFRLQSLETKRTRAQAAVRLATTFRCR